MKQGLAALDSNGQAYELHHIGQEIDSPLAILTKKEHIQDGNNTIWHPKRTESEVHSEYNNWDSQRKEIWRLIAEMMG